MNKYKYFLLLACCQVLMITASFAQKTDANFEKISKAFLNPNSGTILVAAHRGAHLDFPENSMAAFRKAIELGIDIIELDVRCSKDGVLVLMHDKTVDRTTNGKGEVANLTFEELRKLKLKHNGAVTEEQIPTLEEALTLAKGKILVDLDIKVESCINSIMETVAKTKTERNCFFFLEELKYGQMLKAKNPSFMTLIRTHSEGQVDTVLAGVKTEAVHIDPSHYTTVVTGKIHAKNAHAWINALGDVDKEAVGGNTKAYGELIKNGASIIQTDQPALLKAYLVSIKKHF
ncbi:MAG: glycerophosphodiester phosphodiesterase family protein [Chitinophagaceae bacterium]